MTSVPTAGNRSVHGSNNSSPDAELRVDLGDDLEGAVAGRASCAIGDGDEVRLHGGLQISGRAHEVLRALIGLGREELEAEDRALALVGLTDPQSSVSSTASSPGRRSSGMGMVLMVSISTQHTVIFASKQSLSPTLKR